MSVKCQVDHARWRQDAEIFRASLEAMYQTTVNERLPPGPGKAQAVQCRKLPMHQPVFNESWAGGALYRGVHYLDGQLCHRWSNTVPQLFFQIPACVKLKRPFSPSIS